MSRVLNRISKLYLVSVNTPEYPAIDWIINPAIPDNGPSKYWNISGDNVTAMTAPQVAAVDAAELVVLRDGLAAQIEFDESFHRAFGLIVLDEFNNTADTINEILDAADNANNLTQFKTAMVAIVNRPTRTPAQFKTALRNRMDL